jgi:hypothetical protein
MELELLVPEVRTVGLDELGGLVRGGARAQPFSPDVVQLCARFSRAILTDPEALRYPELVALGYWMREAELVRLRRQFEELGSDDTVLVPRGLIFHIPPANVDTMFVYSWLLAALTGNRNVIRISRQRAAPVDILLRLWRATLAGASDAARASTVIVSYGHEPEPTALCSAACDVRVIWGGDRTVATIRETPLPPHAKELAFSDRFSLSAIKVDAYLAASPEERNKLAASFFNDAFWFDQMGCSSPRLLVWCGSAEAAAGASRSFFRDLAAQVRAKKYLLPPAVRIQKLVFSCEAVLDLPVSDYRAESDVVVLRLDSLEGFRREHCGGGLFYEVTVDSLARIAPHLERRDQTLACYGFSKDELGALVRELGGRAIDRIVPIGQALQFHRYWDGYDLLQEFCRRIHLGVA